MIQFKNHKQTHLFDPWEYISPKRRAILDKSWAGLFQKQILPSLPVYKIGACFHKTFGRPSKELYTVIGVLVLQQTFDLTDMETIEQFAFNLQWHKTLWRSMRQFHQGWPYGLIFRQPQKTRMAPISPGSFVIIPLPRQ